MSQIKLLTAEQFRALLTHAQLTREITSVHLHHTWRPRHAQFVGQRTVEGMRNYHLSLGWNDIAQHLTIAPDGGLWTGRNWNWRPASAKGYNGNAHAGPFMIEMVGDFDDGQDALADAQHASVVDVVARILSRFGLSAEQLRFHNEFTNQKTCPGTSLDLQDLRDKVAERMRSLAEEPVSRSFSFEDTSLVREYLAGSGVVSTEPAPPEIDAELPEEVGVLEIAAPSASVTAGGSPLGRGAKLELDAERLAELRKHVINLSHGRLSDGGTFSNSSEDLEAIFFEHLPEWRRTHVADGEPTKIVVFAHGGLVGEEKGLRIALRDRIWWMANGVYPIFLVWETGWREVLLQQAGISRDFLQDRERGFSDLTDWLLQKSLRPLARGLWSGMKESAHFAALEDLGAGEAGGTFQLAEHLANYAAQLEDDGGVEIHAVGHSAGSIIHAHFLDVLIAKNLNVKSLSFLAPAIRVDLFKAKLLAHINGKKVEELALFTMNRVLEEADSVIKIYRKSLLYFVSRACEPEPKTPILGLEVSIRKDPDLKKLFGIDGQSQATADLIWSKTAAAASPRSASQATTHGGFDNDSATMNSVLRRILRLADNEPLPMPHLPPSRSVSNEGAGFPLPSSSPSLLPPLSSPETSSFPFAEPAPQPQAFTGGASPSASASAFATGDAPGLQFGASPRHRALCVGIDQYAAAPLMGCVKDSQTWGQVLKGLGFEVSFLHNEQAKWRTVLETLHQHIIEAQAGEELVFQFAGHGTQLDDLGQDEDDRLDEALVPFDYVEGRMILDDDLGTLYDLLPDGVGLTIFMDCCNSGSNNRAAPIFTFREPGLRARFLPATVEMQTRHRSFRHNRPAPSSSRSASGPAGKEIHFAACQDHELAFEKHGQGEFTRHTAPFLAAAVNMGLDAEAFLLGVRQRFGANPRQNPRLIARGERLSRPLFAGLKQ